MLVMVTTHCRRLRRRRNNLYIYLYLPRNTGAWAGIDGGDVLTFLPSPPLLPTFPPLSLASLPLPFHSPRSMSLPTSSLPSSRAFGWRLGVVNQHRARLVHDG